LAEQGLLICSLAISYQEFVNFTKRYIGNTKSSIVATKRPLSFPLRKRRMKWDVKNLLKKEVFIDKYYNFTGC